MVRISYEDWGEGRRGGLKETFDDASVMCAGGTQTQMSLLSYTSEFSLCESPFRVTPVASPSAASHNKLIVVG